MIFFNQRFEPTWPVTSITILGLTLAKKSKRSKSYLTKEALRCYIDQLEAQGKRRQETLERWEAYVQTGETIEHDTVVEWLESWGDEKEKSCPVIK